MKSLILFFCSLLFAGSVLAQSTHFSFGYKENGVWKSVANGGTITFSIKKDKILDEIVAVRNEQNVKKSFHLKKFYVKKNPLNFLDLFCWDQCYTRPDIMESANPVVFQPMTTDSNHMHLTYMPNGNEGETIIRYRIWDKSTPQDTGYVFVRFIASTTGLDEFKALQSVVVSPNPCSGQVSFLFQTALPAGAVIYVFDLVGREVKKLQVPSGANPVTTDLSSLPDGIYLYRVESQGLKGNVRKLMIQR
jgi:hypothetical protein